MSSAIDAKTLAVTMNIVNQLGDLWKVPVDVRQATNDQCDAFVAKMLNTFLKEAAAPPNLMKQLMDSLAEDGKPVGHMQCNACGYVEAYHPTDATVEEFERDGKATIMRMKEHFAKNGWQTSWGYDLCPECAQEHGKATPSQP